MSDLVEKLRRTAEYDCREVARDLCFDDNDGRVWADLMDEAAAEITRLQKELETAREALANDRDESLWRFWNGKARKLAEDNDRLRERVEKAREAARQFNCPRPCNGRPDDFTVGQCYDAGECGCLVPGVLNGEETASGLSPWQGWDQSRTFWSETKHKDAVCHAVFGPAWSMEDAHVLISFIEKTWGRALKDKEVAGCGNNVDSSR